MKILGIESSCDDTSIAVVDSKRNILANEVLSQNDIHMLYKGVVPELAARSHVSYIDLTCKKALEKSGTTLDNIDLISATAGPGLIGGLLVGLTFAKTLAQVKNKPFVAVNHLEGHALTTRLTDNVKFPFLLLLVSGGHTNFYFVKSVNNYLNLGGTLDDALGEAFDKVAKMIGIEFPGGPNLEKIAKKGNENAFLFAKPLIDKPDLNLSFSGLKTSVMQIIREEKLQDLSVKANIAASFQKTIADILSIKLVRAIEKSDRNIQNFKNVVISGGVASNEYLRIKLKNIVKEKNKDCFFPPVNLCTDNGAMIAWTGYERYMNGLINNLDFPAKPRWPLEERK